VINHIKFLGDVKVLLAFKNQINVYFKNKNFKQIFIIPVPLHEQRLHERGFNQSLYLAKLIPHPILDIVLKSNNDRQSKKKRNDRIRFDNQFHLKEGIDLTNKVVMIVDDIYTTGATIHKIAKLLFEKKAEMVLSFTLFRS